MNLEQYRQQFNEDDAVGWQCIDRHLETVHGTQMPRHYAPALRWRLGGDSPLDGCSIYDDSGSGTFHRHAVSYGCLLYTSPSPRDGLLSRMPSSA